MKPFIVISVYILTDRQGEWWETLKTDGSLDRFQNGLATYKKDKTFPSLDKAIQHGLGLNRRFRVVRFTPPILPSRTWGQEVLHEHKPTGVLVA